MVEPNHSPTKRHEFGLDGRVISDDYRRSIENLRRLVDEFDRVTTLATPELGDVECTRVSVPDDVPAVSLPAQNGFGQRLIVDFEARSQLRHINPDGSRRLPVEGNGDSPGVRRATDVPGVESRASDNEGRSVRVTVAPAVGGGLVRADVRYDVTLLWATGVEGLDGKRQASVGLTGTVLNVDAASMRMTFTVGVAGDDQEIV